MTSTRLACPKCKRTVPEVYWQGVDVVRCPACESEFEQLRFPALLAAQRVERATLLGLGEANCYFHAENRAEHACDGCGRYVCAVCRVPVAEKHFCPSCLETRTERRKLPENHRILYDRLALVAAFLPIIMWPITLVTAPAALVFCWFAWKKPGGLAAKWRRTRIGFACGFAILQICGWLFFFGKLLLK